MKIGINLLYLIPNVSGGTETYGICLVNALRELDQTNEYFIFLNKESINLPILDRSNFHKVVCNVKAMNRPLRYMYEQLVFPWVVRKLRLDLVHSLGYVAPLILHCKNIVTIPDMNYVDLRQNFHWLKRIALGFFSSTAARVADHIITISSFSKTMICHRLGIKPEKVTVTHLGPGWLGQSRSATDWEAIRANYGLPEKYIIAFGGGTLHKNIPSLIQAYFQCPKAQGHTLVIMGRLPANVHLPDRSEQTGGPRVQWLGYVPTEHIHPLLSHSDLFVLPSLYEGFGMPILEAQDAGALVASSNAASLPEIGGDGAIYFDPRSIPAMVGAMEAALSLDVAGRVILQKAARKNLERFSWADTAISSLKVYRSFLPQRVKASAKTAS